MILAVSVALAMLEWTRMSYLSPSAAKRSPVSSACSRPATRHTAAGQARWVESGERRAVPGNQGGDLAG